MIRTVHGYNYVVDVQELIPPMSGGRDKYVARVNTLVRPHAGGPERMEVAIGEYYGETREEATAEAVRAVEVWAEANLSH